MQKAIPRSMRLGFLCGLIIIVVAAALPYRNVQLLQSNERWVNHTMEVLRATDAIRIAATDAESGQRGFLLTQNPSYLDPYNAAKKNIFSQLETLSTLIADNPEQSNRLGRLKEHVTEKFNELEATVSLEKQLDHSAALDIVTTNRGDVLMQQIRSDITDFETAERDLLNQRIAETRARFQHTLLSFLLLSLLSFSLFSGLYFYIIRNFKVRRLAELSLAKQSNLLTSVVKSMSDGLYVIDTKGNFLVHNPVLADIYGQDITTLPPDEWQSHYIISTLDGIELNPNDFPATKVLNGAQQASAEMIIRPANSASSKVVKINARPIQNQDGTLEGVVCITTDISEDKKSELRLRLATKQAESASKAKSEFVANMSHEIRTPLNAILGTTQLLHKTEITHAQKKYLDMITMSGKSLLNILNDVLDFSKIEAGKMEVVPCKFRLHEVTRSLSNIMSMAAFEKDIELIIDVQVSPHLLLLGDSHRLHQILVNLVSNAIKFTERGEVSVCVRLEKLLEEQVSLRFIIRDTGMGMTQAQQDRLFSAFTQADTSVTRQFGGTGLGLIISQRLAQMMGGQISIISSPGVGSEFSLMLPFVKLSDDAASDVREHSLPRCKLLVVDSHPAARDAIARHIATWGWECDVSGSHGHAINLLHKARADKRTYDALLLDWKIISGNSEYLLAEITSILDPATPIVLTANMLGRENIPERILADEQNPTSILVKPITSSNLFDALHEVLTSSKERPSASQTSDKHFQPLKDMRLLVVEDNEFNRVVARDLLEQAGAIVDLVENGQIAVEKLRVTEKSYDIILMDVQMPVMDGFTATKIIRAELKIDTPIIATTAGVTEFERNSCVASGMNDLIAKPIEFDKMIETIRRNLNSAEWSTPDQTVAPSPTGYQDVFDITNLLKIGEQIPGYHRKVAGMVSSLVSNSTTSFETAKRALADKNYKEVARILHTLRGSLGVIGAKKFLSNALLFEALVAENAEDDELKKFFNAVDLELGLALEAAKKWTTENTSDVAENLRSTYS